MITYLSSIKKKPAKPANKGNQGYLVKFKSWVIDPTKFNNLILKKHYFLFN